MAVLNGINIDTPEPVFSIDSALNRPIEYRDKDAAILLIIRLILLDPGTFETHPECGVGLVSKYRYLIDWDLTELEDRIRNQIETYLPLFNNVAVRVEIDNEQKTLMIYINTDQLNTLIPIDTQTGKVVNNLQSMNN